jgi:hypothetical protein
MTYRRDHPLLRIGATETVLTDDDQRVYVFARRLDDEVLYAAFNASDETATVEVPLRDGDGTRWTNVLADDNHEIESHDGQLPITLEPRGAAWYVSVRT